jgi:hypothetical protein
MRALPLTLLFNCLNLLFLTSATAPLLFFSLSARYPSLTSSSAASCCCFLLLLPAVAALLSTLYSLLLLLLLPAAASCFSPPAASSSCCCFLLLLPASAASCCSLLLLRIHTHLVVPTTPALVLNQKSLVPLSLCHLDPVYLTSPLPDLRSSSYCSSRHAAGLRSCEAAKHPPTPTNTTPPTNPVVAKNTLTTTAVVVFPTSTTPRVAPPPAATPLHADTPLRSTPVIAPRYSHRATGLASSFSPALLRSTFLLHAITQFTNACPVTTTFYDYSPPSSVPLAFLAHARGCEAPIHTDLVVPTTPALVPNHKYLVPISF